jgi:acetyl esterase/lipase
MDPNEFIWDILPDPDHSGLIYAATDQSGVYISKDGAATWQKLNQGLNYRDIKVLALSEYGNILYAGSGGAGVFRLGNQDEVIVSGEEASSQTESVEAGPHKPETSQVIVERDMKYGTYNLNGQEKSLLLDLYLPAREVPSPVLLFIHGGGWWEGSKDDCPGEVLAQHGYAVACVNYRLATGPEGCSPELAFPAQIHDVKSAVRWLRLNADAYGLDPDHFGVLGDSSGGHLAALLGVTSGVETLQGTQNLGASDAVQAVVDWFGPVDLTQGPVVFTDDPCTTDWGYLNETYGGEETPFFYWTLSWAYFLGGGLAENATLIKAQQATPLTHIDAEDPPFLVIHGEADGMVPITQSELLVDSLRVAGVEVTFVRLPMIGHGYFPPDGRQYIMSEFLQPTLQFFNQYLKDWQ